VPHAMVPVGEPPATVQPHYAHPLAASVATADRAVKLLSFRTCDRMPDLRSAQWIRCDHALSDPDFFPQWRVQVARQLAEQQPPAPGQAPDTAAVPDKTTGGYVLQWYLVIPSYLGAVLFHSARRVPSLSPRQLSFRLDTAAVAEVALRPGRFWCLPDDPDAGHPDAVPVADEADLGAILRRQVIAHAAHFLTVYDPMVRFGSRTQWAAVTDVLDSALLLAGRSFGSPQAGAADARLVLADGEKPLTSTSTIRELIDDRGRTHWTRLRGSCCFLYAMPGVERPCASCPRINDAERACIFGTLDRP
jgi:FhuF 2Fe-2S C-terminal domain